MQERLDWIKRKPGSWVHWEPLRGGLQAHGTLVQRYPKAVCTVVESDSAGVDRITQVVTKPWWQPQRWLQVPTSFVTEVESPAQMLWSNMALHMSADPQALMTQWHQALEVEGFLMFSCLGPDSLMELRALYQELQWPDPAHEFTDMHDWGDMLASSGFAEPVMDMERITLTFESPERLVHELRGLGRNLHVGRFARLRGRHWHQDLLQALQRKPLQLTFEVIYGHAFKPSSRLSVSAHSEISLDEMRAALARAKVNTHSRLGISDAN
jgi:malonyl-CoA O-methyltransferase